MSCLRVSSVKKHRVKTSNPIALAASDFVLIKAVNKMSSVDKPSCSTWDGPLQQKFSLHHLRKRGDIYC